MSAFPAYAGMNRIERVVSVIPDGVPRVCGDEPGVHDIISRMRERSPRMRG